MKHRWIQGNWRDVCDRCDLVRVRTPLHRCHYERYFRRDGQTVKEKLPKAPKCAQPGAA